MKKNLLSQLDELNIEIEDVSAVMKKMEEFRAYGQWIQERHTDSNIVCEINKYQEVLSIDMEGTITKADSLLQIRYVDKKKCRVKSAKQSD